MRSDEGRVAAAPRGREGLLRLALPSRTSLGFVAAILAVLVMVLLSYRSLRNQAEGATRVRRTLEVTAHLESIGSTLKDAETGQRGFLLTASERYLDPYDSAILALPRELRETRELVADSPAQTQRLAAIERLAAVKLAELKETVDLARSGRREAALELVRTDRGMDTMDRLRAAMNEMGAAERTQAEGLTQEWVQATTLSAFVSFAGGAVLLFLILTAGLMSARDFREQRVQAWLRVGQGELAAKMQLELTVERVADAAAAFLARYLDAKVGAVYVAGRGALRRVGGFALPERARGAPDEPVGGLTKQALVENRLITVTDVPPGFFVSSGLGEGAPRHLVIAPAATAEGGAKAVVELGFLHPPSAHDLELLRHTSETIATSLRAAQYQKELEELLAETQRQAEELQTQQEELRVSNEELEERTRALQQTQEELKNQQAELEQINAQLEEQTQALERQKEDLLRAQGDLQRSNVYKSEFLANMSHELRTPLNSTLILAKLLVDNKEGNLNDEQVKFAQTIYSAGNDLLTLINDILDLSKIEAGKLDVRPEPVPVRRLVDDLMDTFRPVAAERRLELTSTIEDGAAAQITTDPTRLQQILKNLLSNALKFTERGGVSLRVRRQGDGIAFEVKDTGIGIAPEQHGVIFEAFRQADGTTNRKYGGTGLGLSISRDLAQLLGGELALESAPGRGSTFTLELPLRYVAKPEEPENGAAKRADGHGTNGKAAATPRPLPVAPRVAPKEAVRPAPAPASRAILFIEDDPAFARILEDLARELEFEPVVATTAEEGLAAAERLRPSAIVLDVGLPDRSGLSVLDALKHSARTRHIPVHVVAGSDHTQAALEMGALGYAIKPVQREQLVEALRRLEAKFTQKMRRVLVVEDDDLHRESTCRLLAGGDVETVAASTAAAALEMLRTSTFDCMVLDLSLPDRTGFDLLDEMSRGEQYAFPPVIVYTGRSLSKDEEQRLRRYSQSIIIKGARSPERLLDAVTLFLHQVEAELPPERQRMLRDARHREAVFEGKRVLVVEDDVRSIFALSSVLEPKGAKVEIARNGREALTHLRDHPGVDLVLMDVMMPEMDGLQATREIRKQPSLASLPIIALTAKAMIDDRESCLAAGANDYIAKPLDVDRLLSLARVWMPK